MSVKKTVTRSQEFSDSVIDTIREPLIALDQDLRVVTASRSFYEVFKVKPDETVGQLIYDLGNKQWDIPKLRELLETILPEKATFDNYEVEHDFASIGRRVMLLNARQIERGMGKERIILLAIEDITEHKQAETQRAIALEALRQSEEKYRTILENIQEGYFDVDLAGNFTFCNDSMCQIIGYSREKMMGMNYRKFTDKETSKEVFQAFNKVYNTGEPTRGFDWQIIRKDGTKRNIEASASLRKDSSGKPTGFKGIIRDVTERKQAEFQKEAALDAMRKSETRYRQLFEKSRDAIMILEPPSWKFTAGNSTAIEMFKAKNEEEFVSCDPWKLSPERQPDGRASAEQAKEMIEKAIRDGLNSFEWTHKRISGEEFPATVLLSKVERDGNVFLQATVRDITERKQAEKALRQSEEKYRTFIETIQDGYYEIDLTGKYTFVNDMICDHLQYSKEELIGMDNRQYQTEANAKKSYEAFTKVLITGNPVKALEMEVTRKDGAILISEISISLIRNTEGKPIAFRGISRDITGRKQMEETIRESEERFRSIVLWSPDAIIVTDAKGKIEYMNPAAGIVFNRKVESFIGTDFGLPLVDGKSTEIDITRPGKDPGVGDMYVVETEWLNKKAHLITIRDITERKQIEAKIKQAQEALFIMNNKLEEHNRQNSLLSEMRELLQSCSNVQEVPTIVISYAARLFPGTDGALFLLSDSRTDLQSVARWGNFPEDVDNNIFVPAACWGLRQGRVYAVEDMKIGPICPHLKQPSSTAYICLPLIGKGELLGLLHLGVEHPGQENGRQENFFELKEIAVIFAEYLSLSIANIKLSEKLTSQSTRDPLTGLHNRRYMEETIQHEILRAARKQTRIGVVMVDIDHFKQINDTYGHDAGDEFLIKLADFFKLKIRGSDFIIRYGGEEFMFILPESSVEDTYKYAESLRKEIKNMKVNFRGQLLPSITLSFGIAAYPDHGLDTIELIRVADKALYMAKEEGRDRVVIG